MKLLKTLVLLILIAFSCKKEEDVTHPPTKPKLLSPAKGTVVAPEQITFKWVASTDPDKYNLVYHYLMVSSDSVNWTSFQCYSSTSEDVFNVKIDWKFYFPFENGKKYYWKVKASSIDKHYVGMKFSGTSESNVFSFYTIT